MSFIRLQVALCALLLPLTFTACDEDSSPGTDADGGGGVTLDAEPTADSASSGDSTESTDSQGSTDATVESDSSAEADVATDTADSADSADANTSVPVEDQKAAAALQGFYKISEVTLDGEAFDDKDPNAGAKQSLPFPAYGLDYMRAVAKPLSAPGESDTSYLLGLYRCATPDPKTCESDYLVAFEISEGEVSDQRRMAAVICDCKGDDFNNLACPPATDATCSLHWQQIRWQWQQADDKSLTLEGRRLQCKTSTYGCKDTFEGSKAECQGKESLQYKSLSPKCIATKAKQVMKLTPM
ncbi:MAG: hypothetical protein CMH53_09275 [Myxococcales bacterium]|nr:hypothetical protein [Myxococcales bacterium]